MSHGSEGAKIYMARAGLFDGHDACLHWHPGPVAVVINARLAATNMLKVEFRGRTAHAGLEPWKGRSEPVVELAPGIAAARVPVGHAWAVGPGTATVAQALMHVWRS